MTPAETSKNQKLIAKNITENIFENEKIRTMKSLNLIMEMKLGFLNEKMNL